ILQSDYVECPMPARRKLVATSIVLATLFSYSAFAQTNESLEMMRKLQNLQLAELGNPQIKTDAIPPVRSTAARPHRMLILPVQYSNRNFDRFTGEEDAEQKNQAYFQDMLFSEDLVQPKPETLTHYYYHQSKGNYIVTGEVLPIITVQQPSDYYGKPI